jgi:hypothetical protein
VEIERRHHALRDAPAHLRQLELRIDELGEALREREPERESLVLALQGQKLALARDQELGLLLEKLLVSRHGRARPLPPPAPGSVVPA